jgi:hypothetical protein
MTSELPDNATESAEGGDKKYVEDIVFGPGPREFSAQIEK